MDATAAQKSPQQVSGSSEAQKKSRRKRRYGRKPKPINAEKVVPVPSDANSANPIVTPISPIRVDNPNQRQQKSTKTENPVSREVPLDSAFSNRISTSYMDKIKRQDEAKSRENVLAEREAKRLARQKAQDKNRILNNTSLVESSERQEPKVEKKNDESVRQVATETHSQKSNVVVGKPEGKSEKSREEIMAERELKKQAKLAKKNKTTDALPSANESVQTVTKNLENVTISEKPVLSKAERREKQEAQRAAKAKLLQEKAAKVEKPVKTMENKPKAEKPMEISPAAKKMVSSKLPQHRVKLFNHLYADKGPENVLNSSSIHPAIVKLGAQYANGTIVGSNARCIAFMEGIKKVIGDFNTPSEKEFGRGLEAILHSCDNYLQQCRPSSVSIKKALEFIKWQIRQLPANQSDAESKEHLLESVDTYVRDQIETAAQAISIFVQEKISNRDVILTFGCSSLICHIIEEAQKRNVDFSVVVVDSRPHHEGQEMLRRLVALKIHCTLVLINAIGFVMPGVTKVLLGANALLANGYVRSRAGTAQVALVAKSYNVPVLVCCETHKFSEHAQTDAFVYNEIGDPQDLVLKTGKNASNEMQNWKSIPHLTPLNLRYDVTPPELVTAVVTERAILPCTSVPVILRIRPSENGY